MKRIALVLALLSIGCFLAAGPATAITTGISSTSNLIAPAPDGILDTLYGLSNLQRVDDYGVLPNDQIWFNPDTGTATAQAKFAGFAHEFGYIPDTNGNGMFEEAVVPIFFLGGNINMILSSGPSGNLTGGPVNLIWALKPSGAQLWTSLPDSRNIDHMVTWLITGGQANEAGNYVIAWEDLPGLPAGSDRDFNDLVVEVTVATVPIPAAILLLGSGLVGLAGIRKKFKR
jgi:hypothetical protein